MAFIDINFTMETSPSNGADTFVAIDDILTHAKASMMHLSLAKITLSNTLQLFHSPPVLFWIKYSHIFSQ